MQTHAVASICYMRAGAGERSGYCTATCAALHAAGSGLALRPSARSLNDDNLELVARRWVDLGRPTKPDWSVLLAGIVEAGDRAGGSA
jgi:hypothetical protein